MKTKTPYSTKSKKSGKTYYLHSRQQKLRNSTHEVTLYFFAGEPKEGAIDAIPAGYELTENERTGLPMLRKAALWSKIKEEVRLEKRKG